MTNAQTTITALVQAQEYAQLLFCMFGSIAFAVASVGGIAAWPKYLRELKHREWDRAYAAYDRFVDVAIDNPEFIAGFWSDPSRTPEERNKYRWLMARFPWAAEQALLSVPEHRRDWESAVRVVLYEHADFIRDPRVRAEIDCYYGPLARLVEEVVTGSTS